MLPIRVHTRFLALALIAVLAIGGAERGWSNPLNQWNVSCSVDPGAITSKGKLRTFRTSKNYCEGGVFSQRAEISTEAIPTGTKGAYLFETRIAMRSGSTQQFTLFQVHDGRLGCAPPLSMDVTPDGRLLLKSDIKTGEGESCIRGALNDKLSRGRIQRDGTEQKLAVVVDFDGGGGFAVHVWIDDDAQISGRYDPSRQPAAFKSRKFFFKHGVYSLHMFDYVMTSRELRVRRVKLRN